MYQGRMNMRIKINLLTFGTMLQTVEMKHFHFSTVNHQATIAGPCPPPAALRSCVTSQIFAFPGSTWWAQVLNHIQVASKSSQHHHENTEEKEIHLLKFTCLKFNQDIIITIKKKSIKSVQCHVKF